MNFRAQSQRPRRRPGLTPMIDVVFLLLVFFMLAARFGTDMARPLTLATAGAGKEWQGAPRVIDVVPEGVRLNGVPLGEGELMARVQALLPRPDAPVLVRPRDGARLQQVIDVIDALGAQGVTALLVEAP